MPIKELNSFLKSNNCSDKIKDDVKILRRTLRNRGYAKKRRDKLNEEAEWYQENVKELNEKILNTLKETRECNKEMLIYINQYKELCQKMENCQEFTINYNIMSPEKFHQETENLQYHKNECKKLDDCLINAK